MISGILRGIDLGNGIKLKADLTRIFDKLFLYAKVYVPLCPREMMQLFEKLQSCIFDYKMIAPYE